MAFKMKSGPGGPMRKNFPSTFKKHGRPHPPREEEEEVFERQKSSSPPPLTKSSFKQVEPTSIISVKGEKEGEVPRKI